MPFHSCRRREPLPRTAPVVDQAENKQAKKSRVEMACQNPTTDPLLTSVAMALAMFVRCSIFTAAVVVRGCCVLACKTRFAQYWNLDKQFLASINLLQSCRDSLQQERAEVALASQDSAASLSQIKENNYYAMPSTMSLTSYVIFLCGILQQGMQESG